jgi:hypothetical protein
MASAPTAPDDRSLDATGPSSGTPADSQSRANADLAQRFRASTQAERLRDPQLNAGAKIIAAADALIDGKYQPGSVEHTRMKDAAREAVAQTIERGGELRAPRARAAEASVEQQVVRENEISKARDRDQPGSTR